MPQPSQPHRLRLRKLPTLRRQQDHHIGCAPRRPDVLDRPGQRLRLHHHPRSAAIRHVVHAAVPIGRVVAQVVNLDVQQAPLDAAADHPFREPGLDHPRKDRDDVELHSRRSAVGSGQLRTLLVLPTAHCRLPTPSRLIQLQQPLGRLDPDPFRRDIDLRRRWHAPAAPESRHGDRPRPTGSRRRRRPLAKRPRRALRWSPRPHTPRAGAGSRYAPRAAARRPPAPAARARRAARRLRYARTRRSRPPADRSAHARRRS